MTKDESEELEKAIENLTKANADVEITNNILCDAETAYENANADVEITNNILCDAETAYENANANQMVIDTIVIDMVNDLTNKITKKG